MNDFKKNIRGLVMSVTKTSVHVSSLLEINCLFTQGSTPVCSTMKWRRKVESATFVHRESVRQLRYKKRKNTKTTTKIINFTGVLCHDFTTKHSDSSSSTTTRKVPFIIYDTSYSKQFRN